MRLKGLDSIRIICAVIVVFGHLQGPPIFHALNDNVFLFKIIKSIYANSFNGPAAVIVFFIISGLVIHFPYTSGKPLNIPEFYIKRYLRIGIPMLVVTVIAYVIDRLDSLGIFWSLYAELIYYTIYPLIIILKNKISLKKIIFLSFIITYIIIFMVPYKDYQNYIDVGNYFTWLIGLPVWLLGLLLAESIRVNILNKSDVSYRNLLIFRVSIFFISIILQIAKFHLSLSYSISLNLFALIIYLWLSKEVLYYMSHKPYELLEKCGNWSYSLYICHILGSNLILIYAPNIKEMNYFISWIVMIFFIFLFSYIFYLIVEKPSHLLAKKIKTI